ncbi:MAG: hypothetical protein A4E53_02173 [Pelotomaculum sp. PtaB.Bin104]|nr:MAG: hypothetical protein A4E53_02173 [Pelotomaculum sp. PtaB.Bin104]
MRAGGNAGRTLDAVAFIHKALGDMLIRLQLHRAGFGAGFAASATAADQQGLFTLGDPVAQSAHRANITPGSWVINQRQYNPDRSGNAKDQDHRPPHAVQVSPGQVKLGPQHYKNQTQHEAARGLAFKKGRNLFLGADFAEKQVKEASSGAHPIAPGPPPVKGNAYRTGHAA